MEFSFSREQEELRREARSFLDANADAPLSALRELGWLGVSVPEERGGGGLSFVDEAILFEEAGRALYAGDSRRGAHRAQMMKPSMTMRTIDHTGW